MTSKFFFRHPKFTFVAYHRFDSRLPWAAAAGRSCCWCWGRCRHLFLCTVNGSPLCLLSQFFSWFDGAFNFVIFHPSLPSYLDVGHGWDFRLFVFFFFKFRILFVKCWRSVARSTLPCFYNSRPYNLLCTVRNKSFSFLFESLLAGSWRNAIYAFHLWKNGQRHALSS